MKDIFSLKDKIIVVTGGSGNLGTEFTNTLIDCEAKVVVLDILADEKQSNSNLRYFKIDITKPEWGDYIEPDNNDVFVFWACGVTPQSVLENSKPDFCITHSPGKMLITDKLNNDLAAF